MNSESSRLEFIAIPVVAVLLGVLFALMLAGWAGAWAWILVTAGIFILLVVATVKLARRRSRAALDMPTTSPTGDDYRVLVIADGSLTAGAIEESIAPHAAARPVDAFVIAPALRSRLAHWTGDDSERDEAERHLADTLSGFDASGIRANGKVGPDDPIQAADDGLRLFPADELVFVTGGGDENWLERGILDTARERYDVRITHIESGSPGS